MPEVRRAELLFKGGRTWTGVSDGAGSDCVAVGAGRILAVGSEAQMRDLRGPRTRDVDVGHGLLLPAFGDCHAHPLWGGLAMMECDLSAGETPEEWLTLVARYAAEHPQKGVIYGEGWTPYPFPAGLPHRELLDAVVPDRPVVLEAFDGHTVWCNTAALVAAGVDASTADPPHGRIERDPDGDPIGVFHEDARDLVSRLRMDPRAAGRAEGLRLGQAYMHGLGISAWLDAIVDPVDEAAYVAAASEGRLTARVALALRWDPSRGLEQVAELVERREAIERASLPGITAAAVKFFADGVVESATAALLAPYADGSAADPDGTGPRVYDAGALEEACAAVDAAGFDIHIHAIGDAAVRQALDAIEAARVRNGRRKAGHAIAHLELVDDADIPRFATLDVIAACQPLWAVHDTTDLVVGPRLGPERLERRYPFGKLRHAGASLALGSDWNVSSADPLQIMHAATTRTLPDAPDARALGPPTERLAVEEALRAYTRGSARVLHLESETGTLEAGKAADLVLLDRDPLDPGVGLTACRVVMTVVGGRVVHESP